MRDSSETSPSHLFQQLGANWQQRPETPALIRRIHTSSSHHTPHQCSDSAEEWIRPEANHPLRPRTAPLARLPPTHQHHWSIPQMRECSRRHPPSKEGVRTNNLTYVSINNQNACQRKGSNSSAIGGLGVTVFRRQMQQVGCLVLLFHLGELFHQSPGVLRRHFPIVLPFDARQFSRRHQGKTFFST